MPPKLVQMMLNLATSRFETRNPKLEDTDTSKKRVTSHESRVAIYDPFCGLGTTLIEAANMGITRIYGSDLSKEMVHASE